MVMRDKVKRNYIFWGLTAAVLSMAAVLACFFMLGVYPFGEKSVLTNDCYIQYVDFFRYYKEVLSGNAHIGYSFSKSLGGSAVALFGYYLASPFNLLLVFFQGNQIEQFVFLTTILKIGLCGFTFCLFIRHRLPDLKSVFAVFVSLAYAFTQYNVGQLSNISWLDGVYMLPLILWGIWRYVSENKKGMLYISIGLSIVFNWYTGYMNCLFAVIYFLYEQISWNYTHHQLTLKKTFFQFIRFCVYEFLGVLLSCAVFLPVVFGQSSGRGILDEGVFFCGTNGSFLNIFRGFMIGTPNMGLTFSDPTITLFCSVFLFLGAIYYFVSPTEKAFNKICMGGLVGIMVLSEFLHPLENIWCGFKFAYSFRFRFAYITIFTIIFAAARALENFDTLNKKVFAKIAGASIGIFLIFDVIERFDTVALAIEVVLIVFYGLAVYVYMTKEKYRRYCILLVVLVFFGEIVVNSYFVASDVYWRTAGEYAAYETAQSQLVDDIHAYDDSLFYRIEQNQNREKKTVDSSFLTNESLAYGYSGIQQYSSAYDNKTVYFLTAMGYCKGYFPTFYHEPILTSDSLLGIKYLMATKEFGGYEKVSALDGGNGKEVYENPYALPLGFEVDEDVLQEIPYGDQYDVQTISDNNPFEFQNKVYSALLGEDTRIYEQIPAEAVYDAGEGMVHYAVKGSRENNIIYGYNRSWVDIIPLYINQKFAWNYRNGWGDMGVIQISDTPGVKEVSFDVGKNGQEMIDEENIESRFQSIFYELNMDVFEQTVEKLRADSLQLETFEDGYVAGSYHGEKDGWLMLTIPNESNWIVKVNGAVVEAQDGVNTFMTIPIKAGDNSIELKYHPKGVKAGIGASCFSIVVFGALYIIEHRKRHII